MKNIPSCSFAGDRDEAIVEYLYGEGASEAHLVFQAHLEQCHVCRAEVGALGGVRHALTQWAPPEPRLAFEPAVSRVGPVLATPPPQTGPAPWAGLRAMPGWAQAAAAVLCVGVAAGAANLRVTYGADGVSVHTGWIRVVDVPSAAQPDQPDTTRWRTELTALGDELRSEIRQAAVVAAEVREPADAANRQIRTLISQSEQRQQRELALRIGDVLNDVQSQRRADLSKIDRTIGLIQNNTGMEVMRQREMLNSLAVRVSTQR
jgi:hypothetical protein